MAAEKRLIESVYVQELYAKAKLSLEPWSVENYDYVKKVITKTVAPVNGDLRLGAMVVTADMYFVGVSNIVTLVRPRGPLIEASNDTFSRVLAVVGNVAWLNHECGWLWESAVILQPEELARVFMALPAVPKTSYPWLENAMAINLKR